MANPISGRLFSYQSLGQTAKSPTTATQEYKPPKEEHEILAACRTGNLPRVKELLKSNPGYINQAFMGRVTGEMLTPLYLASQEGHKEVVKFLLSVYADPNSQCDDGETALFSASGRGYDDIVTLLLENGANPDLPRNDGATALMQASNLGHMGIVTLLLAANANPNLQLPNGVTALFLAAQNGHEEVVKSLKAKANPFLKRNTTRWSSGQRPLEIARIQCQKMPQKRDIYQRIIRALIEMEEEWKASDSTKPGSIKGYERLR